MIEKERERENSKWREMRAKSRESQFSRGKRRAPATSSLTAVNGPSLRRNTVRERSRENKRLPDGWRQRREAMEKGKGISGEGEGWKKREWKRRYLYYSKKSDRENRETGRLRLWQSARISRRMRRTRTREMYRRDSVARGWNLEYKRKRRHATHGWRDTRIAILPQDHFLCKIKYCRYDAATRRI